MTESDLRWACLELAKVHCTGFYGKIVVAVEEGRFVHLEKRESLKPPDFFNKNKKKT